MEEKINALGGKVKRRLSATQKFKGSGKTQGDSDLTHSCDTDSQVQTATKITTVRISPQLDISSSSEEQSYMRM